MKTEYLVEVAEQEIGLKHPPEYDDFNFCELFAKGRLAKVLGKQKLSQLQSLCKFFDVEIIGRANRKASYTNLLCSWQIPVISASKSVFRFLDYKPALLKLSEGCVTPRLGPVLALSRPRWLAS